MHAKIVERLRSAEHVVQMEGARWIVYPERQMSFVEATTSSGQFIYMNAPVVAVRRDDGIVYLNEDGEKGWSSNLRWPRAHLQMVRLVDAVEDASSQD